MANIKLPCGSVVTVDDDDLARIAPYAWYLWKNPKRPANRYAQAGVGRTTVKLHRVIMNAKAGQIVDHVNGDTLDCRKANLRFASVAQNAWNQGMRRSNTSGFKGVRLERGGWHASIRHHRKLIHLGTFKTPEEASRVYEAAAGTLFGMFARQ